MHAADFLLSEEEKAAAKWRDAVMAAMSCEQIADSFSALLRTCSYSQITIKMICEAVPVSRNTFYYYFENKESLVEWICIQDYKKYSIPYFGIRADNVRHKCIFSYIKKKRFFYEAVYAIDDGKTLNHCLVKAYEEGLRMKDLGGYLEMKRTSGRKINPQMYYCFVAAGVASVVLQWIKSGMKMSIEEAAENLTMLFTCSPEEIITLHLL